MKTDAQTKSRQIVDMHLVGGVGRRDIAERLGVERKYVDVVIWRARKRRGTKVPTTIRTKAPTILQLRADGLSVRQIAKTVAVHVSYAWSVIRAARIQGGELVPAKADVGDTDETPREAKARVARELAGGRRCKRCWLLLPCDHEEV